MTGHDSDTGKRYFKALDLVQLWTDTRCLPVTYIGLHDIGVSCKSDLSKEAEMVCKFITLIIGHTWTYRIERTGDEYKFIFHEAGKEEMEKKKPVLQPENQKKSNQEKQKDNAVQNWKSLFE